MHRTEPTWRPRNAESALIRALVEYPPWIIRPGDARSEDRGMKAAFRRWSVSLEDPSPDMIAGVYRSFRYHPRGLEGDQLDRAIRKGSLLLHLFALGADDGVILPNLGAACAYRPKDRPVLPETRFARLVNTPPLWTYRLAALERLFRRFRAVRVRVAADDTPNLLRFIFEPEARQTVTYWANAYFRSAPAETAESPTA